MLPIPLPPARAELPQRMQLVTAGLLEELYIPPPLSTRKALSARLPLKVQLVTLGLLEELYIPPPRPAPPSWPFWRVNPWRREAEVRFWVDKPRPPGPPLAALGSR